MARQPTRTVALSRLDAAYVLEILHLHKLHLANEHETIKGSGSRLIIKARMKRCERCVAAIKAAIDDKCLVI